jgi:hypothetical protein
VPPTALTPSVRYFRPEVTKVIWVVTITTVSAPTRSELNAGTDLSGEISELSGFQVVSATVDTPDLGSRFTSKIPGRITADDSSINFYATSTGFNDARSVLPRDTSGFVVIMDAGDVSTTGRMSVYPSKVAAHGMLRGVEDPAMTQAQFTITSEPSEDLVIPA